MLLSSGKDLFRMIEISKFILAIYILTFKYNFLLDVRQHRKTFPSFVMRVFKHVSELKPANSMACRKTNFILN